MLVLVIFDYVVVTLRFVFVKEEKVEWRRGGDFYENGDEPMTSSSVIFSTLEHRHFSDIAIIL